ncbi:putative Major Facilitator Superfamily Organic Anion Transporter Polypeptide (OATP) family [Trypanosoma vivax]|nr:putative MFS transporter [Trypanosoma vivax]KAH8607868.1 putative Major Facilitator Superfamily Organic Anion Transporter Polypeptide (OATP) family [Trypanosoma vivax]
MSPPFDQSTTNFHSETEPADAAEVADIENELEANLSINSDPWRHVVAGIFCLLSITNAMQWITFSAIFDETRRYFGMTAVQVNYLASTYVIAYVVTVFLSCKLYEVMGLRVGIVVAALANTIGASLKLVALYAWPNMILLYISQVFNSVTEILTIATPPLVANRWFPVKERVVANTVMSIALAVGCGLGAVYPVLFVTPEKQEQRHFGHLFWSQFGMCGTVLLLTIFCFPARPRCSPSYAAALNEKAEQRKWIVRGDTQYNQRADVTPVDANRIQHSVRPLTQYDEGDPGIRPINIFSTLADTFRALRTNPSFVFLSLASATELGLIWAMATVLPQCLLPFGVHESETGWISFLNLVLGSVVAPFVMRFIGYRWKHRTTLLVISIILLATILVWFLCFQFGPTDEEKRSYYVISAFVLWGGLAGLCQNFMMPIMFEFVIELTFPMQESTSAPVLTWTACLTNLILTIIFGEVLGNEPTRKDVMKVFIGTMVVSVIGVAATFLVRPQRRRQDFEALMIRRRNASIALEAGEGGARARSADKRGD